MPVILNFFVIYRPGGGDSPPAGPGPGNFTGKFMLKFAPLHSTSCQCRRRTGECNTSITAASSCVLNRVTHTNHIMFVLLHCRSDDVRVTPFRASLAG